MRKVSGSQGEASDVASWLSGGLQAGDLLRPKLVEQDKLAELEGYVPIITTAGVSMAIVRTIGSPFRSGLGILPSGQAPLSARDFNGSRDLGGELTLGSGAGPAGDPARATTGRQQASRAS